MMYVWLVEHPTLSKVQVQAKDKLGAIIAAANIWKRRWTQIAKDCVCTRLRKADVPKSKPRMVF